MEQRHLQLEETDTRYIASQNSPSQESPTEATSESSTSQSVTEAQSATQEIQALANTLRQEMRGFVRSMVLGGGGIVALCWLLLTLMNRIKDYLGEERWAEASGLWTGVFLLVFLSATLGLLNMAMRPRKRRRVLAHALARREDVRAIGPLIDALGLDDAGVHEIAADGLIRLLPRLKASDADLLSDAQKSVLIRILNEPIGTFVAGSVGYVFRLATNRDFELRLAILKAFEQVGDKRMIGVVERLANIKPKNAGQKRIKEAAEACLPALQSRIEQKTYSQTLLRAAEVTDAAPATLLRAATGTASESPEQLLRPGPPV